MAVGWQNSKEKGTGSNYHGEEREREAKLLCVTFACLIYLDENHPSILG